MTAKPRKTADAKDETASSDVCVVDGCAEQEFEPGRGLCDEHFATRLDLREAARHD